MTYIKRMGPTLEDVVGARLSRRAMLRGMLAGAAAASVPVRAKAAPQLTFEELAPVLDDKHHLATGYDAQVLLRWGDPILLGAPAYHPRQLSEAAQLGQYGYNNDFSVYLPLDPKRPNAHGLLCVNHEYTDPQLMFPGLTRRNAASLLTPEQAMTEQAAHGHSVVEIEKAKGGWRVVQGGRFNRRITARTPMRISGPAAGHGRLRTSEDPTGRRVLGTIGNCGGGKTPWGTVLISEENVDVYFEGPNTSAREADNHARLGTDRPSYMAWHRFEKRWRVNEEPHEPNRFGWVVELDPFDPTSTPVKRTALGRLKHESATVVVNRDGRVVVYSGDDERFEYLYRFVSARKYDPKNPAANRDLLDDGELCAARFDPDGHVEWLPLVFGQGALTEVNGFFSQADVLIESRRAAEVVGATPMDRPEDVEWDPVTGRIFVALTNNNKRAEDDVNAANPRCYNHHGHILELDIEGGDYAARAHGWTMFLMGDDPRARGGRWLSCPDNFAFDAKGRMWICTDGQDKCGMSDSLYASEISGPYRGFARRFFNAPRGAEVTGPSFTPDGSTLFLCIQHPAQETGSTFDDPSTRWPDFDPAAPPRPSLLAITKQGGGPLG